VVVSKQLLDVFVRGALGVGCLFFLKSETDRGRLYVFSFMIPVKVMSHVKNKRNLPNSFFPQHVFEYTLGIANRVELNRFNQSRKGGSFFWIRRVLRFCSRHYQSRRLHLGLNKTQKNLRREIFCVTCVSGCSCSTVGGIVRSRIYLVLFVLNPVEGS
jgi:hypothetical protein